MGCAKEPLPDFLENEFPGKNQEEAFKKFRDDAGKIFTYNKTFYVRFNGRCPNNELYFKITLNIFQRALRCLLLCFGYDRLTGGPSNVKPGEYRQPVTFETITRKDAIFTVKLLNIKCLSEEQRSLQSKINDGLLKYAYKDWPFIRGLQLKTADLSLMKLLFDEMVKQKLIANYQTKPDPYQPDKTEVTFKAP